MLLISSLCLGYAKVYDFSEDAYDTFRQEYKRIVVPSGQIIHSRLNADINSEQNTKNETLTTQLIQDWKYDGKTIAPEGSLIIGKITDIKNAGYASGNAKVIIVFNQIIKPDNTVISIQSKPICITIGDSRLEAAGKNIMIGALSGMGRMSSSMQTITAGALSGAYVFAATKGQEVVIPFGTEFRIQILNPVNVLEYEY